MKRICDLKGLGEKSEQTLAKIGIVSVTDLQKAGAIQAFLQLKQAGLKPSLNFLYALVGALEGRSWLDIAQHEKGSLLMAMEGYDALEKLMAKEGTVLKLDLGERCCALPLPDVQKNTCHSLFIGGSSAPSDILEFKQGQACLKYFESSPSKKRYFCANCGSHIYAKREDQEDSISRLGTLDGQPKLQQGHHIWLSEKASWYDIDEACVIPRFDTWSIV